MKKILITGAGGFIGKNLAEQMAGDYNILAPLHQELDLLDSDASLDFLRREKFDTIIHCATHNATKNSRVDVSQVFHNNLRMFFNLARGSRFYRRMIYFGSGAEYGREFMPPKVKENFFGESVPTDDYGFSKYVCNLIAEKSDNIYNLTLFGCFGKYEDWQIRFISNIICKAIFSLDITMRQNVYFDYLYINDLAKIVKLIIESGNLKYHKYNVCAGQSVDLLTLAKSVLKISDKQLEIKISQQGFGREYSGNNQRLLGEIGEFKFTSIEQSIKELYQWYKSRQNQIDGRLLLVDK